MVHSIHMIFFLGTRNTLHHIEGEELCVGSQESSSATSEDNKMRAEISKCTKVDASTT